MITPAVGTRQSFAAPFGPISSIGAGHLAGRERTSTAPKRSALRSWLTCHLKSTPLEEIIQATFSRRNESYGQVAGKPLSQNPMIPEASQKDWAVPRGKSLLLPASKNIFGSFPGGCVAEIGLEVRRTAPARRKGFNALVPPVGGICKGLLRNISRLPFFKGRGVFLPKFDGRIQFPAHSKWGMKGFFPKMQKGKPMPRVYSDCAISRSIK
jgi:hypothetical protein